MVRTHLSHLYRSALRHSAFFALVCLVILAANGQKRGSVIEPDPADKSGAVNGKYYALVIGINQYPAPMPQLKTAVNDATAMASLLKDRYGFEVTLLIDGQATRQGILNSINKYRSTLSENDSLLIYYGGHGYYDKDADKAYWLPVDAEDPFSANRIIADDLTSDLKALRSRHVLIISDSCYSGGLSRGVNEPLPTPTTPGYVSKQLRIKSRNLMSSGGIEPVADAGTDGHSVFAYAVLKGLEEEDDAQFAATDLFYSSVRKQVAGNSEQIPEYTVIRNSSDDGGDFVFTRKDVSANAASPAVSPGAKRSAAGPAAAPAHQPEPTSPPLSAPASSAVAAPAPAASGGAIAASAAFDRGLALLKNSQFTEALPLMTTACNGGLARGCGDLGVLYQNGKGVSPDLAKAAVLYRKGCDGQSWRACYFLGSMYSNGTGVGQDQAQAAAFYRRGCEEGGDPPSCNSLGIAYENGSGVTKDDARATTFFSKACDASGPAGCSNLGIAYAKGDGVARNPAQATALFHKACDLGFQTGCQNVSAMNANGNTGAQSPAQSAAPGTAPATASLPTPAANTPAANTPAAPGNTITPVEAFNQGLALHKNRQYAAAQPLLTFACNGGNGRGCGLLGMMYANGTGVAPNPLQAAALYRKACDGGDPVGCSNLGLAYHAGAGVPKDQGQAAALSLKGCLGGAPLGCNNLGVGYEFGFGVPRNKEKAVTLYRQACSAGLDQGCKNLKRLQP
jgi:TPR repeat protein